MGGDQALDLHREFLCEMTQRIEQGGREVVRALENVATELKEVREELSEMRAVTREDLRDLGPRAARKQTRPADDRPLDNGGPAAAGAS